MQTLHIATYNIHKGFSHFNRRVVLHTLRERLRELDADVMFLQEVQGEHKLHPLRYADYPDAPQHEFLAADSWSHAAYGRNAVYAAGHHGNAILSRYPLSAIANQNISAHRFESRGLLHSEIKLAEGVVAHGLCAHFGLFVRGRRAQTELLIDYVRRHIPLAAPLIIAGDFNDWGNHIGGALATELGLQDAFHLHHGRVARSYPAAWPVLRLDRVYVRGFKVLHSHVHHGGLWRRISDHAALSVHLQLP